MNLPDDTHLAYIVSHEAWYWSASKLPGDNPHLNVSASAKGSGGGVAWEFEVEEVQLDKPVARIKIFEDAFAAFAQVPELFAALADGGGSTLADVRNLLDMLGAVDETERVSPYPDRDPAPARGPHDSTIREALRLAVSEASNDAAAERYTAALAAMDREGAKR